MAKSMPLYACMSCFRPSDMLLLLPILSINFLYSCVQHNWFSRGGVDNFRARDRRGATFQCMWFLKTISPPTCVISSFLRWDFYIFYEASHEVFRFLGSQDHSWYQSKFAKNAKVEGLKGSPLRFILQSFHSLKPLSFLLFTQISISHFSYTVVLFYSMHQTKRTSWSSQVRTWYVTCELKLNWHCRQHITK